MQLSWLILANTKDEVERKERCKTADRRRKSSEDSELRTIVAIISVERVPDEAAVAGFRAKHPDLPLELDRSSRNQWKAQSDARIADGKARRKIVAPVDHQVMVADQLRGIFCIDPLLDRLHRNEPVQPVGELRGHFGFGITGVPFTKERLPLEVRKLDRIAIDNCQLADACAGECWNDCAADASSSNDDETRTFELALSDAADLRQDDMPRVALKLGIREVHWPVEPKPPAPRVVSLRLSTSLNAAFNTGAGTSCAIRSPRRTGNGWVPRFARMTFTSPR